MGTAKIHNLYCAVDKGILTNSESSPLAKLYAKPVFGDSTIFRFSCFANLGETTGFVIDPDASLEFVIADQVAATLGDIAAYAYDAKFNVGNWTAHDRTLGKVGCDLIFNSDTLETMLTGEDSIDLIGELVMSAAGTSTHVTLAQFDMTVLNTVYRVGLATPFSIDLVPGPLASSSSSSSSTSSVNSSSSSLNSSSSSTST